MIATTINTISTAIIPASIKSYYSLLCIDYI